MATQEAQAGLWNSLLMQLCTPSCSVQTNGCASRSARTKIAHCEKYCRWLDLCGQILMPGCCSSGYHVRTHEGRKGTGGERRFLDKPEDEATQTDANNVIAFLNTQTY